MIKIVLHCLPNELDQVAWIVDQLKRSSRFIDPKDFTLDFTLNVSDEDINWDESLLTKEFCVDKFDLIFKKSPFHNDQKVSYEQTGCNSVRREAIRSKDNTTHIAYLDTDLIFPDNILFYINQAIGQISNKHYIITPQIFQLWDKSWDVISNQNYRNLDRDHQQWLQDPYQVFSHTPKDIELIVSPYIKFGGGWFNVFSKDLLNLIDIPDSLGHYGLDDTFVAEGANLLKNKGYDIEQYILNDIIVKEDRVYRSYSMDPFIKRKNNQSKMRGKSESNYTKEIQKLNERI
jgi:hypothetical protein